MVPAAEPFAAWFYEGEPFKAKQFKAELFAEPFANSFAEFFAEPFARGIRSESFARRYQPSRTFCPKVSAKPKPLALSHSFRSVLYTGHLPPTSQHSCSLDCRKSTAPTSRRLELSGLVETAELFYANLFISFAVTETAVGFNAAPPVNCCESTMLSVRSSKFSNLLDMAKFFDSIADLFEVEQHASPPSLFRTVIPLQPRSL